MFERFTDRARRVVVLAQEEARRLNHNYIGTEHILLGLIQEGGGHAAKALEELNINIDSVRSEVVEIIGEGKNLNLKFNTNVDDTIVASKDYPIRVSIDENTNEPSPYVLIRKNLEAKISRSVFYELVNIAEHHNDKFGVWSGGSFFAFSDSKEVIFDE